jgi:hypothetical protein
VQLIAARYFNVSLFPWWAAEGLYSRGDVDILVRGEKILVRIDGEEAEAYSEYLIRIRLDRGWWSEWLKVVIEEEGEWDGDK